MTVLRPTKSRPLTRFFRNILWALALAYLLSLILIWYTNLRETEINLHHINSSLLQSVRTTLKGHELILRGIGNELIQSGALENPASGRGLIERMNSIDPGISNFGLVLPSGQVVLKSGYGPGMPLPNYAEQPERRESFKRALQSKQLMTGRPQFSSSIGEWVIPIRTAIHNENGQVQAIVEAEYILKNATAAWNNTDLPPDVQVAIMRDDGYLIFAQPLTPRPSENVYQNIFGQPIGKGTYQAVQALKKQGAFTRIETPRGQDTEQYLSYRYLPEYSLHIGSMKSVSGVVKTWLNRIIAPTILFLVFVITGLWTFKRAVHEQREADTEIGRLTGWQQAVLDGADYSIISTDTHGTIVSFNQRAEKLLGYKAEEVIGKVTPEIIHDRQEVIERAMQLSNELGRPIEPGFEAFVAKAMQGKPDAHEWTYIRKDGNRIPVWLSVTPLFSHDQRIIGFLGIATDLTEQKNILANLQESEVRYQTLFDSASDAIFLMQDDRFIDCNKATLDMFGCTREQIVESTPQQFSPDFQPNGKPSEEEAKKKITAALNGESQFFEWLHARYDGSLFDAEVSLSRVQIGNEQHILAVVRDITDRKRLANELEFQARHDSLTGLPNRESLHEAFPEHLEAAAADEYVVLMLLDLNRFKEINDTLGHHVGDRVLEQIGPRLRQISADGLTTIARLGGDEFAILTNTNKSVDDITSIAYSYLDGLRAPIDIKGMTINVGASIGIAYYPEHGSDSHELLRAADVAMYQAKKMNYGLMLYHEKIDGYSTQRLGLISDLSESVEKKQLVLHYQPKININNSEVVGLEALVRWQHPEHGLLYPDAFIDIVEMSELIHEFTREIINLAVEDKGQLDEMGYAQPVAINLSARNLFDYTCLKALDESLIRRQVPAEQIEIELTESAVMLDPDRAIKVLNRFRAEGVNISIDDFGTGYSSLAYLRKLPVSTLKIDKSFVMNMKSNAHDKTIVSSTIALAHSLGLKVTAEGVEDENTLFLLRGMGCDYAQGYGICRPVEFDGLIRWLSSRNSSRAFE